MSPEQCEEREFRNRLCRICGKPVSVETAKLDEKGATIHNACYLLKLKFEEAYKDRPWRPR